MIKFGDDISFHKHNFSILGSRGCGAVGRVAAYDTRDLQFEFSHLQFLLTFNFVKKCHHFWPKPTNCVDFCGNGIRAMSKITSGKSQAANRKRQIASVKSEAVTCKREMQAGNRKWEIASGKSQAANRKRQIASG